jgi:hypothetical protein
MHSTLHKTLPVALLLTLGLLTAASANAAPERESRDSRGFLYGRVTTRGGTVYEGRLRWNKEEAFWSDFFNADKDDLPFLQYVPRKEQGRRESIEVFGIPIGISHWEEENGGRQLVARFGDLRRIEVEGRDDATVVFKSGVRYAVEGGSNDIDEDTEIHVWDRAAGEIRVRWKEIRTIDFLPTPANLAVPAFRLRGTVETEDGSFQGYIQWDQDECLSTDELDGDTRDGDVSLKMGEIRSIERRSRRSSDVVLRDGRTFTLDGSNDVDSSNRGIYVHDWKFGRVLIDWDTFLRVDFDPPGDSGPAYTDFRPGRPLFGKVSTSEGKSYRGRLVYDVDEEDTMELLNGQRRDVEYSIPFARIAFLVPERTNSSRVVFKDGTELKLSDAADVGRDNAGMLVFGPGQKTPRYIAWEDVRRIDFENR